MLFMNGNSYVGFLLNDTQNKKKHKKKKTKKKKTELPKHTKKATLKLKGNNVFILEARSCLGSKLFLFHSSLILQSFIFFFFFIFKSVRYANSCLLGWFHLGMEYKCSIQSFLLSL